MRGIGFNGRHSWYTFHAVISECEKPVPEKKTAEETIPFSNVTYDYSCLNGKQTYEDRTLYYLLSYRADSCTALIRKTNAIVDWLYKPTGRIPLTDDEDEGVHYLAKCTRIGKPDYTGCVCRLPVTFTAYPLKIPDRPSVIYTTQTAPYPDINGDGVVDTADASIILAAVAAIGIGEDPGLTPEQLDKADADRDGDLTAADASLVIRYVSQVGIGKYEQSPEGWVKFMNDQIAMEEGRL